MRFMNDNINLYCLISCLGGELDRKHFFYVFVLVLWYFFATETASDKLKGSVQPQPKLSGWWLGVCV